MGELVPLGGKVGCSSVQRQDKTPKQEEIKGWFELLFPQEGLNKEKAYYRNNEHHEGHGEEG